MRAVVQRVNQAQVTIVNEAGDESLSGKIADGLMVLLGVAEDDQEKDAAYLADKLSGLRIFEDEDGKMNRSLLDTGGAMLVVSQFTLLGDCKKGRRPSFIKAAPPELAERLYEVFVEAVRKTGTQVETGRFRTDMRVSLTNVGPVTLIVESR